MKCALKTSLWIAIVAAACCQMYAQDEGDDDPRGNTNLGLPMSAPLNPTGRFVHLGLGATVGAGYNFTRRHAVVGEFMWNSLFPTKELLTPIRIASQDPTLSAGSNIFALTGNYRFELRGKAVGIYFIGGGGYYYRNAHLSQRITTGSGITCTPDLALVRVCV